MYLLKLTKVFVQIPQATEAVLVISKVSFKSGVSLSLEDFFKALWFPRHLGQSGKQLISMGIYFTSIDQCKYQGNGEIIPENIIVKYHCTTYF